MVVLVVVDGGEDGNVVVGADVVALVLGVVHGTFEFELLLFTNSGDSDGDNEDVDDKELVDVDE